MLEADLLTHAALHFVDQRLPLSRCVAAVAWTKTTTMQIHFRAKSGPVFGP